MRVKLWQHLTHFVGWSHRVKFRYDYHYSSSTPLVLISTKYPVHDRLCFCGVACAAIVYILSFDVSSP